MSKYKRFLFPFDFHDIEAIEGWLEDKSADGLELVSISRLWARFKTDGGGSFHYRVAGSDSQSRQTAESRGWEFVSDMGESFAVFRSRSASAEIYPDPEQLAASLKKAARGAVASLVIIAAMLLSAGGYLIYRLFASSTPLLTMISGGSTGGMVYIILLAVVTIAAEIVQTANLAGLRRRLLQGQRPDREKKHKSRALASSLLSSLSLLVCIGYFIFSLGQTNESQTVTTNGYDGYFPFVTLWEIDQTAAPGDFNYDGVNYSDYIRVTSDLLADACLELTQYAAGEDAANLRGCYYELRARFLADRLVNELNSSIGEMAESREIAVDGADRALYFTDGDYQWLVVQRGCKVMELIYQGESDLLPFADSAGDKLA